MDGSDELCAARVAVITAKDELILVGGGGAASQESLFACERNVARSTLWSTEDHCNVLSKTGGTQILCSGKRAYVLRRRDTVVSRAMGEYTTLPGRIYILRLRTSFIRKFYRPTHRPAVRSVLLLFRLDVTGEFSRDLGPLHALIENRKGNVAADS